MTDQQLQAAAWLTCHIVEEIDRIYGVEIPIDREHMIGIVRLTLSPGRTVRGRRSLTTR